MNKLDKWKESKSSFDFNEQLIYQQIRRNKQKVFFKRMIQVCTCVFALIFVLSNTSTTYIKATKDIPLLNNLNEFVNLNKNMYVAIKNDYLQEMNLVKEDGNLKVELKYLVADEKNVYVLYNTFYKNQKISEGYDVEMSLITNKEYSGSYSWYALDEYDCAEYVVANTEIIEDFVIDKFEFQVECENNHVSFEIDVDENDVIQRKSVDVNETISINGQLLDITKVEVYPLSMRIHTKQHEKNDYFIENVKFDVKINNKPLETSNGLIAIGDEFENYVYIVPSPYFIDENYELVIKSVELIEKPGIATFNTKTYEWNDPTNKTSLLKVDESLNDFDHDYTIQVLINEENYNEEERRNPLSIKQMEGGVGYSSGEIEGSTVARIYLGKHYFEKFDIIEFYLNIGEKVEVNKKVKLK